MRKRGTAGIQRRATWSFGGEKSSTENPGPFAVGCKGNWNVRCPFDVSLVRLGAVLRGKGQTAIEARFDPLKILRFRLEEFLKFEETRHFGDTVSGLRPPTGRAETAHEGYRTDGRYRGDDR
jgi:hypothetical protein